MEENVRHVPVKLLGAKHALLLIFALFAIRN